MDNSPSKRSSRQARVIASPRARRKFQSLGLDPASIPGSGPAGRIIEADVVAIAAKHRDPDKLPATDREKIPGRLSIMRRAIAEKTALSAATIPHFYLRVEADITELMKVRSQLTSLNQRDPGVKLTLTDFLLHAMARAFSEFPSANSIWQNDIIVPLPTIDIGLVVGLSDGLLIPILRGLDRMTLGQLAKQRTELVASARAGTLRAEHFQGGATSLSNLGAKHVDEFAAVISPQQSTILAVGRAAPRPFAVQDTLAVRTTLRLCLSVDHRVMDGGPAAELLGHIVDFLENPRLLVYADESASDGVCD